MKLFRALVGSIAVLAAAAFATVNPQLHQVKRVYILSMGSGLDQYLANQLTKDGIFEVVTDPKKADAIVTDNIGEAFQSKLDILYPPPPGTPLATKPAADSDATLDVGDTQAKGPNKNQFDFGSATPHMSTMSRGKGNFFVVDRNSRVVLWSVYERPKNSSSGELEKTAGRVVKHLKDDLTDKKPGE
jgi:hypothetical protein